MTDDMIKRWNESGLSVEERLREALAEIERLQGIITNVASAIGVSDLTLAHWICEEPE